MNQNEPKRNTHTKDTKTRKRHTTMMAFDDSFFLTIVCAFDEMIVWTEGDLGGEVPSRGFRPHPTWTWRPSGPLPVAWRWGRTVVNYRSVASCNPSYYHMHGLTLRLFSFFVVYAIGHVLEGMF